MALVPNMPGEIMNQMQENKRVVHRLARGWIADKARALEVGKDHRDIMTLLGNYAALCQVWHALTFLQLRRTAPMIQSRNFPNTRWSLKYGWHFP